jgi:hypothetical protein
VGQPLQLEAHHRAADMVGMVMGDQHAGQVHAVGLKRVEQIACRVCRVDHDAVTGLPVADQVREVAHLRRDPVTLGEVAAGE